MSEESFTSPLLGRKTKNGRRKSGNHRRPLSGIKNVTPRAQTPKSAKKKQDDIAKFMKRPMSPILPEIPVTDSTLDNEPVHVATCDTSCQTETTTVQDKSIQTDPEVPIEIRMMIDEFPPIEYWIITAEKQKKELQAARQEIENLHEEIDRWKEVLQEKEKAERTAEYFAFMYKVASSQDY